MRKKFFLFDLYFAYVLHISFDTAWTYGEHLNATMGDAPGDGLGGLMYAIIIVLPLTAVSFIYGIVESIRFAIYKNISAFIGFSVTLLYIAYIPYFPFVGREYATNLHLSFLRSIIIVVLLGAPIVAKFKYVKMFYMLFSCFVLSATIILFAFCLIKFGINVRLADIVVIGLLSARIIYIYTHMKTVTVFEKA